MCGIINEHFVVRLIISIALAKAKFRFITQLELDLCKTSQKKIIEIKINLIYIG